MTRSVTEVSVLDPRPPLRCPLCLSPEKEEIFHSLGKDYPGVCLQGSIHNTSRFHLTRHSEQWFISSRCHCLISEPVLISSPTVSVDTVTFSLLRACRSRAVTTLGQPPPRDRNPRTSTFSHVYVFGE